MENDMAENDDRRALEPQGLIAGEILVPEAAAASDVDLVAGVVDFVNWAMGSAHLVSGEIAPETLWSYHADYYLAQVNNGGHGQFARNSRMGAQTLANCRHGLVAMGATEYVAILDDFMRIMSGDSARAKAIQDGSGFGEIDPEIKELDARFFALKTMTALNAAWLRTLPVLRLLPENQTTAARDAVIARNARLADRQDYLRRAKERSEATDPIQVAARATCAQEGITFEGVNAGIPIGNGSISWGLRTSAGLRMLVVTNTMAALRAEGALRGQYFYETKTEYPIAVGDGALRRTLITASARDVRARIKAVTSGANGVSRSASPETVLAEFLEPALAAFWGAFTSPSKRINSAIIIPYLGANASRVSYVPRAASPLLAASDPHALLRLILANALWDSVIVSDALKESLLEDTDAAGALLANLGAAAAAAATSLRMLDADRIGALALLAPDDLAREQCNIRFQLVEIGRWWFTFIPSAIEAFSKIQFPRSSQFTWLYLNVCGRNARLLDKRLRPTLLNGVKDALAYFDREYPVLSELEMAATYRKALLHILFRFGGSKEQVKAWGDTVSTLRGMITLGTPFDDAAIFVVTPDAAKVRTHDKLVGVATVLEGQRLARQAFVFLKHGERAPLQHNP